MKYRNYDITLIVTQRCNARCIMCNSYANPTKPEDEISISTIRRIPPSKFIQITGGEPFVRTDIEEIVKVLLPRTKRLMINTNGYYTDRIVELCRKYPQLVMRVSIDGRREVHNSIRRIEIYDAAMKTLSELKKIGIKDLGMSFTLQDSNYDELLPMYHKAQEMGIDFGTSVVHNSFYFSKDDNKITNEKNMENVMHQLVHEQLSSSRKKDWARAFYNDVSIKYINNQPLPIHCDAGFSSFIVDAESNILPCNMTPSPWVMGNLKNNTWDEVLGSHEAIVVQDKCRRCQINCWSVCNVQTEIKKKIWIPGCWFVKNMIGERIGKSR